MLLVQVVTAIRQATSSSFVVGVKINCKERRHEGMEREAEALDLVRHLCDLEMLDFINLSGGGFEDAMQVQNVKAEENHDASSTTHGETGYFFESFAKRVKDQVIGSVNQSNNQL